MSALDRIDRKLKRLDALFPQVAEPWQPQPGPQTLAYHSDADDLLYGGQPGGGKTDLLLGLALTAHRRSLILRRQAAQLSSIRTRLDELGYPPDRLLELGGCKEEKSKIKWKGRPHDLKAFDEITEFTRSQFEFIKVWNRTGLKDQRCRVVATSNPPETTEGRWIMDYWAPWLKPNHPNPAVSGELRYFVGDEEVPTLEPVEVAGQWITPRKRCFIASSIYDNPILMLTGYDQLLLNLTGDLAKLTGSFFDSAVDHPFQVIPTKWVEDAQARWREEDQYQIPCDVLAADVARGGKDQMVLALRHGRTIYLRNSAGKNIPDGQAAAAFVMAHYQQSSQLLIDLIGVGTSCYDILNLQGLDPIPYIASAKSFRRDRTGKYGFANKRSESWWNLRQQLDPSYAPTLALPKGQHVLADLTAPRFSVTLSGITLESKEEVIKRLGHSPDEGDSIVMACDTQMIYESAF